MNSFSRYGPLLALVDFNVRLHRMHAGESHFIGPHIFGNKNAHFNAESNRSLLLEMVSACPWKNKSPCYNVGSSPAGTLNSANFGVDMSLAPHQCPAIAEIDVELLKTIATTARDPRYHLSELRCACTSSVFVTSFHEGMSQCHCENRTADELRTAMATSFQQRGEPCMHQTRRQANKPWIRSLQPHIAFAGGNGQRSNVTQPSFGEDVAWSSQTVPSP